MLPLEKWIAKSLLLALERSDLLFDFNLNKDKFMLVGVNHIVFHADIAKIRLAGG